MRFKLVQSEADGLFMKANRKHEILLNFELKRIAVEKKMRERYFAFEKSLMVAHQTKIITRQKALGIYRPKTTPDKKRTAATNPFFIANVSMETKGRTKLPPLRELRRKAKHSSDKEASASAHESPSRNLSSLRRESPPNEKQGWSLTEVEDSAETLLDKYYSENNGIDSFSNALVEMENRDEVLSHKDASSSAHHSKILPEQKAIQTMSKNRPNSVDNTTSNEESHVDIGNSTEKTSLDSQQVAEERDAQRDTDKTHESIQRVSGESIHTNNNDTPAEDRPKSASSLENSVENVKTGLLNLNLRAQSAGIKAK